jgi:hypothetical protein
MSGTEKPTTAIPSSGFDLFLRQIISQVVRGRDERLCSDAEQWKSSLKGPRVPCDLVGASEDRADFVNVFHGVVCVMTAQPLRQVLQTVHMFEKRGPICNKDDLTTKADQRTQSRC